MLKFKTLLFFLIIFQSAYSQTYNISGYVEDLNTGERAIGAYVVDNISKQVAQTNNYGFYTIRNVGSKSAIQATYTGFKSDVKYISLVNDTVLNFKINPVKELKEVVVVYSKYRNSVNTPLGLTTIPVKQLTLIPALGESDLIKSIQSQAGIKGGVEGSAGIFVRGGSGGENLFMLDDVPLYNVSHLYGFFSVFNSSAVKDIKLLKGCFPARYGGRVSSVIDVRSLDGNNKTLKGEISLGFISSKFTLEGPLFSDKTTFMVSGRRSYFDIYSGALKNSKLLDQDFPDYYFYDLNARLTHTFSQRDKIYLSIYKGKDNIQIINENTGTTGTTETNTSSRNETSGWGNLISSLRWNHIFGNSLFANTTIAYSSYDYFTENQYKSFNINTNSSVEKNYMASYRSNINDLIVKTDFNYSLSNKHLLSFGAGNTFHTLNPGKNSFIMDNQELNVKVDTSYTNQIVNASEPFFYIEDEIKATEKLSVNMGLRFSGFISDYNRNFNFEPRMSVNYAVLPRFVIKTGYSRMVQYTHLLSTSGVSMPTDLWVPAIKGLQPLKSDQLNIGFAYDWEKSVLFSVEIYQKWLANTTDIRNGMSLITDPSPWYEKTEQGHGKARGIELSIEKQQGRLTGSIHYTLSTANRSYANINNGQSFPFKYDRRHDFNISANFQISKKWDLSAMWLYGTGYPVTLPVERYAVAWFLFNENSGGQEINYYPSRNNVRLPAYHRLDLGLHYKTNNRLGEHNISFDVFNAYSRRNPVNAYHLFTTIEYIYLLPCIPSITYTLKF